MDPNGAAAMRFCHVLLTGPPGIGKTTVCKKVISLVKQKGLSCDGFYTEEIRSSSINNKRIGFDVVPLKHSEYRLPLARTTHVLEPQLITKFRVGNYVVFVDNFEQAALSVFQTDSDVLLIDEIGKMELFSKSFIEKVDEVVFREQGGKKMRCMLATIPEIAPAHLTLIQKLRSNPRCKVFEVRSENRDILPEEISEMIFHIVRNE